MTQLRRITPFLWFDTNAEEAATFYVSIFENSKISSTSRYNKESAAMSGRKEGSAMTVSFELDGQKFTALNGGPHFKFTEAVSFVVNCESQKEIDYYWDKLSEGGNPASQQCGWLKDKFGLSWQIIPTVLPELLGNSRSRQGARGHECAHENEKARYRRYAQRQTVNAISATDCPYYRDGYSR